MDDAPPAPAQADTASDPAAPAPVADTPLVAEPAVPKAGRERVQRSVCGQIQRFCVRRLLAGCAQEPQEQLGLDGGVLATDEHKPALAWKPPAKDVIKAREA